MDMKVKNKCVSKSEGSNLSWWRSLERSLIVNAIRTRDFFENWRNYLLSADCWSLSWLWTSLQLKLCTLKIRFASKRVVKKKLMAWISTRVPNVYVERGFPACFKDGILLCALVEKLVNGACPRFDLLDPEQYLRNLKLALYLVEKYIRIKPEITVQEILEGGRCAEKKLILLIAHLKLASEKFSLSPVGSNSSEHKSHATFFTDQCIARGMGLLLAVKGRKSCFSILMESTDDLDMVIEIRGPKNTACSRRITNFRSLSRSESTELEDVGDPKVLDEILGKKIPLTYHLLGRKITVYYTPLHSGTHHMSIIWHGQHILGSPYTINVDNSIDIPDIWQPVPKRHLGRLKRTDSQCYDESFEYPEENSNLSPANGKVIRKRILRQIVKVDGKDIIVENPEDLCSAINSVKNKNKNKKRTREQEFDENEFKNESFEKYKNIQNNPSQIKDQFKHIQTVKENYSDKENDASGMEGKTAVSEIGTSRKKEKEEKNCSKLDSGNKATSFNKSNDLHSTNSINQKISLFEARPVTADTKNVNSKPKYSNGLDNINTFSSNYDNCQQNLDRSPKCFGETTAAITNSEEIKSALTESCRISADYSVKFNYDTDVLDIKHVMDNTEKLNSESKALKQKSQNSRIRGTHFKPYELKTNINSDYIPFNNVSTLQPLIQGKGQTINNFSNDSSGVTQTKRSDLHSSYSGDNFTHRAEKASLTSNFDAQRGEDKKYDNNFSDKGHSFDNDAMSKHSCETTGEEKYKLRSKDADRISKDTTSTTEDFNHITTGKSDSVVTKGSLLSGSLNDTSLTKYNDRNATLITKDVKPQKASSYENVHNTVYCADTSSDDINHFPIYYNSSQKQNEDIDDREELKIFRKSPDNDSETSPLLKENDDFVDDSSRDIQEDKISVTKTESYIQQEIFSAFPITILNPSDTDENSINSSLFECDHDLSFCSQNEDEEAETMQYSTCEYDNWTEKDISFEWHNTSKEADGMITFNTQSVGTSFISDVSDIHQNMGFDDKIDEPKDSLLADYFGSLNDEYLSETQNKDQIQFKLCKTDSKKEENGDHRKRRMSWTERELLPAIRESSIEGLVDPDDIAVGVPMNQGACNFNVPSLSVISSNELSTNGSCVPDTGIFSESGDISITPSAISMHEKSKDLDESITTQDEDKKTSMDFASKVSKFETPRKSHISETSVSSGDNSSIQIPFHSTYSMNLFSASPYRSKSEEAKYDTLEPTKDLEVMEKHELPKVISSSIYKSSSKTETKDSIQSDSFLSKSEQKRKEPKYTAKMVETENDVAAADTEQSKDVSEENNLAQDAKVVQCLSVKRVIQIFQNEQEEPMDKWPTTITKPKSKNPTRKSVMENVLVGSDKNNEPEELENPVSTRDSDNNQLVEKSYSSIKDRVKLFEKDDSKKTTLGKKQDSEDKANVSSVRAKKNYWENISS